jgi:hypothetical protein
MGILDTLRSVLGVRAETDAASAADPDALFGMSTAYVTMEANLGYGPAGAAALCFSSVDSTAFADAVDEVETILHAGKEETGTTFHRYEDDHGYHWVVLEDDDPEDLVTSVHFAADEFVEQEFRLAAAGCRLRIRIQEKWPRVLGLLLPPGRLLPVLSERRSRTQQSHGVQTPVSPGERA